MCVGRHGPQPMLLGPVLPDERWALGAHTHSMAHWRDAMADSDNALISVMLAVPDAARASEWYRQALGAEELWNLGAGIGLAIAGAPLFLGEPQNNGWDHPARLGMPSVRVEVFCADPDAFIARAVAAGARARSDPPRDHAMPWGPHRQGS